MKKHRFLTVLLVIMLCLIGYSVLEISKIGNTLQYLFIAKEEEPLPSPLPEKIPDTNAQTLIKALAEAAEEWQNIISAYTLTGITEKVSFSAGDNHAQGRMVSVSQGDLEMNHRQVLYGRNFYPEELQKGRAICLIDEQLAIALFRVGDATGRKIQIAGKDYEVMGVLRHSKKVGDYEEQSVYVPLVEAAYDRLPITYYMVSAKPIKGGGAKTAFAASMRLYAPGGTMWDLNRESVGATLSVRVFLFLAGLTLLILAIKRVNKAVLRFVDDFKRRLISRYAVRLLPRLILFIIIFAVLYGIVAGVFAFLVSYILEPVYIYPEWIPSVLVEWKDINTAFWKVWQADAQVMSLRSPEILRLRFFTLILQWMTALCAAVIPVMCMMLVKQKKQTEP